MLRILILALALAPAALQARVHQPQTQEELFLAAHAAVRAGHYAKAAAYDARLQDYLLEPYVQAWLLYPRLDDDAADRDVRAFLDREEGTILAQRVRKEWLKALGKRHRWDLFRSEYPLLVDRDSDINCYALQARWEGQDASALDEAEKQWRVPRELPDGCVPLVEALIDQGEIGANDIWKRIRALLEVRAVTAAWHTAQYLPHGQAPSRGQLFSVAAGPRRYLKHKRKNLSRRADRELTIFALQRLARSDPLAAAGYWNKKLRARFTAEERGYVWGRLALQAAWHNLPEALEWYGHAEAAGTQLSEKQLAWRLRAALREGNWNEVRTSALMMSLPQRDKPVWIYWRGRAERALGNTEDANALFERIADERSYYGELAAEELGRTFTVPPKDYTPSAQEVAAIGREPGFRRAQELYRLDLWLDAVREWAWSIRGMDDKELLAAAEFARENRMFDRAINTANKTSELHDFSVRYLAPFRDTLGENARAQQLEEAWVLGLVRQESRFIPAIKSSAGAAGLMQLMPATAKWVARRMGMRNYSWSRVTDTEVNAALGTYYLRHVLDDLDGNPMLAVAAYNAGPRRANSWRDARPLEGAIYVETIPFDETRDYVKKVMINTMYYAAMLGGSERSLKARLGVIAPRGGDANDDEPK